MDSIHSASLGWLTTSVNGKKRRTTKKKERIILQKTRSEQPMIGTKDKSMPPKEYRLDVSGTSCIQQTHYIIHIESHSNMKTEPTEIKTAILYVQVLIFLWSALVENIHIFSDGDGGLRASICIVRKMIERKIAEKC